MSRIKSYYLYRYEPDPFHYPIGRIDKIYFQIRVVGNACYIKYVVPPLFKKFRSKEFNLNFYHSHNIKYVVDFHRIYEVRGQTLIELDEMFFIRKKFNRKFKKVLD